MVELNYLNQLDVILVAKGETLQRIKKRHQYAIVFFPPVRVYSRTHNHEGIKLHGDGEHTAFFSNGSERYS